MVLEGLENELWSACRYHERSMLSQFSGSFRGVFIAIQRLFLARMWNLDGWVLPFNDPLILFQFFIAIEIWDFCGWGCYMGLSGRLFKQPSFYKSSLDLLAVSPIWLFGWGSHMNGLDILIWLVLRNMTFYDFPFSWEFYTPNWLSLHHFSEGLDQPHHQSVLVGGLPPEISRS